MKFRLKPVKDNIYVKWLGQQYIPEIMDIEMLSSETIWNRTDFELLLTLPAIDGLMVCKTNKPVGYVVYESDVTNYSQEIQILNLTIHPDHQREGIGTILIDQLKKRLLPCVPSSIRVEVRESNLGAQLFLKENGFKAENIIPEFFEDYENESYFETENAYLFYYNKKEN